MSAQDNTLYIIFVLRIVRFCSFVKSLNADFAHQYSVMKSLNVSGYEDYHGRNEGIDLPRSDPSGLLRWVNLFWFLIDTTRMCFVIT